MFIIKYVKLLICSRCGSGKSFTSSGIIYTVNTDGVDRQVIVTGCAEDLSLAGNGLLTVPSSVVNDTTVYDVTIIGESAFENNEVIKGVYRDGVPLEMVVAVLGHSSSENTKIYYAIPSVEQMREALSKGQPEDNTEKLWDGKDNKNLRIRSFI